MTDENKQDLMTPARFNGLPTLEKAKYLRKHAEYITGRNSYDRYLTKIYLLSDFFVEMIFDIKLEETVEDIRAVEPAQEDTYLQKVRAQKLHRPYTARPALDFFEEERRASPGAIAGDGCWRIHKHVRIPQLCQPQLYDFKFN